jgi:hypothetical protein
VNNIINRFNRRIHLTEELVEEAAMRAHREAMVACDVDDLISECLESAALLRSVWAAVLDFLFSGDAGSIDELRPPLMGAIGREMHTHATLQTIAQKVTGAGYAIKRLPEYVESTNDLNVVKAEIEKKWPVVDREMIARSVAAYKRGDFQSSEDLLRETQREGAA